MADAGRYALPDEQWRRPELSEPTRCRGNQHTCQPKFYIPELDRHFELVLRGTGDSMIVGHRLGPRAMVWKDTALEGEHPELGRVRVTLQPEQDHLGVLLPLEEGTEFPALNRNTYFFLFEIEKLGEMVSERPAIVEAIIADVPPTATYEFKNGPLNFHLRSDPERRTVAVLQSSDTHVEPETER